jgi:hypothetical protein
MLEFERLQIVKRPATRFPGFHYEIRDAVSELIIGQARIRPSRFAAWLGRLTESRFWPVKLEAFETDDEPLVFTVRRDALVLRGEARIADADDHRLGRLVMRGSTSTGGFWILDRHNLLFLTGEFLADRSLYVLTSSDSCVLASLKVAGSATLVNFDAALHERPPAKMLILGAALALDLLFPSPIESQQGTIS